MIGFMEAHMNEFGVEPMCRVRRLLQPIGNIPPAEAEANYYATLEEPRMAA